MFLSSFIVNLPKAVKTLIILMILSVNSYSLIFERSHYSVLYNQPFERFSVITRSFNNGFYTDKFPEKFKIIFDGNPDYIDFYFNKNNPALGYESVFNSSLSLNGYANLWTTDSLDYLVLGNVPSKAIMLAKETFPNIIFQDEGLNYQVVILGKKPGNNSLRQKIFYSNTLNFEKENYDWTNYQRVYQFDQFVTQLDSSKEFGPMLDLDLDPVINSRHSTVEITLDYISSLSSEVLLTCAVIKDNKTLIWDAVEINQSVALPGDNNWNRCYFATSLTPAFRSARQIKGAQLRVSIWNPTKENLSIDNINVKIVDGNHLEYASIEPID
jgi:hypothetical protein